jgi:hypothetical protein
MDHQQILHDVPGEFSFSRRKAAFLEKDGSKTKTPSILK